MPPRHAAGNRHFENWLCLSSVHIAFLHHPNRGFTLSHVTSAPTHEAPSGHVTHDQWPIFPAVRKYCDTKSHVDATTHFKEIGDQRPFGHSLTRTKSTCKANGTCASMTMCVSFVNVEFNFPASKLSPCWLHWTSNTALLFSADHDAFTLPSVAPRRIRGRKGAGGMSCARCTTTLIVNLAALLLYATSLLCGTKIN